MSRLKSVATEAHEMHYLLAPHVFMCRTPDHVVMLDLRRDKYLALDEQHSTSLSRVVVGWPSTSRTVSGDGTPVDIDELTRSMLDQDLLTIESALGKPATPVDLPTPAESLAHSYFIHKPRITVGQFMRFALACILAAFELRFYSLERIVRSAGNMRSSRQKADRGSELSMARHLVAVFEGLRPFSFAGTKSCMFDALALLKFLSFYRIHPNWVFGVRTTPFCAHCWVQWDECLFNDVPDRTSTFTPIMIV
jgi:hypothetical protein